MKNDIIHQSDIETLVNKFYDKVNADEMLGPLFAHVNWEKHLPVMYNFWQNTIFHTGGYQGNPMKAHQNLHQQSPLTVAHFNRWLVLFNQTLDENFEGMNTILARQRATSIATVLRLHLSV